MPYITQEQREKILLNINFQQLNINEQGELNFLITKMCHHYLKQKTIKYASINDIIGVLECAKLEFYRKIVADYEDIKEMENGSL
jgi:hypothetical protein